MVLSSGTLAAPTREVTVHQVRAYLSGQSFEAPIANMLEQHHAEHNFSGRGLATASLALPAALHQLPLNQLQQLFVLQGLVRLVHPGFVEIPGLLLNQAVAESALGRTPEVNHRRGPEPRATVRGSVRRPAPDQLGVCGNWPSCG